MSDCLFCNIANKKIPAYVIGENEKAAATLDIHPLAPGHAMVIPKSHRETIFDVPNEDLGDIFLLVKETAEKIEKALSPGGFTFGINHGTNAGQAIAHLHIHIIPRYKGDGGGSIHSIVRNPPTESIETIKQKILEIIPPQRDPARGGGK